MVSNDLSVSGVDNAPVISRRFYNLLTYGMIGISFLITSAMYGFVNGGGLEKFFSLNPIVWLVVYLVGSIGGFIVMGVGKSKQSVPITVVGYAMFVLTFGGTLALLLTRYNVGTVTYAFGITACLSGIFLIAGITFPEFFSKIGRVLLLALIGLIVVEFVSVLFFHINQTIFDYIAIAIFCGFLGFDSYKMSQDAPTVPNAIFYAADIYIDIVNILIRILDIMDRN